MQAFITFSDCTAIVGFSVPKTAIPNKMAALAPILAQGSGWTVQVLLPPYPVHLPVYFSVSCKFFKVNFSLTLFKEHKWTTQKQIEEKSFK